MSKIEEYSRLSPLGIAKNAEIFVACASYEERCQASILSTTQDYSLSSALIMCSREHATVGRTNEFLANMIQKVQALSGRKIEPFLFNLDNPIAFDGALRSLVQNLLSHKQSQQITIDITTFPRQQLFLTLKQLRMLVPSGALRILYTEPKTYSTEKEGGWSLCANISETLPTQ
jgi:hypothetical protein